MAHKAKEGTSWWGLVLQQRVRRGVIVGARVVGLQLKISSTLVD